MKGIIVISYVSVLLVTAPAFAVEAPSASPITPRVTTFVPKETKSVTHGSVTVNGKIIKYTATAGTILLRNEKAESTASIFYVAYTGNGANPKHRPITFLYDGGPGSSLVFIEMGSFSPVRVVSSNAKSTPPPPYDIVLNNQYSSLDKSDLVFVEQVGTGYSRVVGEGTIKDFWGVDEDTNAFGQFIKRYLTEYNRWNSPKYLLGVSYGTTRSANLADWLQNQGVALNGVILQSSVLNYGDSMPGTDLEYITYLPTYAAIAWYHNKVPNKPTELVPFLETVRRFARGEYADALFQGSSLSQAKYDDVLAKLHQYTGLSEPYLRDANLKVSPPRFRAELLRDQHRIMGRYDARFEGINADDAEELPDYDPSDTAIVPAYAAAWNWYVLNILKYHTDLAYRIEVPSYLEWDLKHSPPGRPMSRTPPLPDVAANLGDVMRKNPHLQVFLANGYFDLATPFFKTEYDIDQLDLPPIIYRNIHFYYYLAGHRIYPDVAALAQYKADLAKFYDETDK